MSSQEIQQNLEKLKIPKSVKLVAVSKKKPTFAIVDAYHAGQRIFGESYMNEAVDKIKQLKKDYTDIKWHFIGPMQSNKTKDAVQFFDLIHSVDRVKIARRLDTHANQFNKKIAILIQVNIGDESQKSGVSIDKLNALIDYISQCNNLTWQGFMCIPPFDEDPVPYFKKMKVIFDEYKKKYSITELSMGMSADYLQAIDNGATIVRIGTKIFGER